MDERIDFGSISRVVLEIFRSNELIPAAFTVDILLETPIFEKLASAYPERRQKDMIYESKGGAVQWAITIHNKIDGQFPPAVPEGIEDTPNSVRVNLATLGKEVLQVFQPYNLMINDISIHITLHPQDFDAIAMNHPNKIREYMLQQTIVDDEVIYDVIITRQFTLR